MKRGEHEKPLNFDYESRGRGFESLRVHQKSRMGTAFADIMRLLYFYMCSNPVAMSRQPFDRRLELFSGLIDVAFDVNLKISMSHHCDEIFFSDPCLAE